MPFLAQMLAQYPYPNRIFSVLSLFTLLTSKLLIAPTSFVPFPWPTYIKLYPLRNQGDYSSHYNSFPLILSVQLRPQGSLLIPKQIVFNKQSYFSWSLFKSNCADLQFFFLIKVFILVSIGTLPTVSPTLTSYFSFWLFAKLDMKLHNLVRLCQGW